MASYNISQFRALVSTSRPASDPEVKRLLARISIEAKAKLGDSASNSAEFFESLKQSLCQLRGYGNADVRIACLLDCANYFYVAGRADEGIEAARDAIALADRIKDRLQLRKSQTLLGILLADSGSVAQAIESYAAAIELAKRIGDDVGYVRTVVNLGVALLYASQFDDAIACFSRAEVLGAELEDRESLFPHIFANKALCYLHQNNIEEGLISARRSIVNLHLSGSVNDLLSRIVREFNYVQLLLEAGAISDAADQVRVIKIHARKAQTPRARILSTISEGLVEVFKGDASRGLDLLLKAEGEASSAGILHDDALVALVKSYEQLGRYGDALARLHELMQDVRERRAALALQHLRSDGMFFSRASDLRALQHREALLRAKVAEDQLLWSQIEMLERLAVTADLREEATGEHGYRVGRLSAALAEELGWSTEACLALDLAARLHDIGKIGVPDRILLTSQELKEAERHFMCTHTVIGSELLAKSNISQLRMAEEIALSHHECWDGSGYPRKLKGRKIPIHARIVALADVFDALTHGRPYAAPWSMDRALEEIRNRRGTQFDPDLTDRFLLLIERLRAEHENLDEFLGRAGRNSPFLQARRKIKVMLEQERDNERRVTVPGNQTRH